MLFRLRANVRRWCSREIRLHRVPNISVLVFLFVLLSFYTRAYWGTLSYGKIIKYIKKTRTVFLSFVQSRRAFFIIFVFAVAYRRGKIRYSIVILVIRVFVPCYRLFGEIDRRRTGPFEGRTPSNTKHLYYSDFKLENTRYENISHVFRKSLERIRVTKKKKKSYEKYMPYGETWPARTFGFFSLFRFAFNPKTTRSAVTAVVIVSRRSSPQPHFARRGDFLARSQTDILFIHRTRRARARYRSPFEYDNNSS